MKINKWLVIIFLVVFLFRLYFVFQSDYFSDDTSYSYIRQLEYTKENLKPMTYDELSYGGKPVLISPIFSYLLTLFSIIPYGLKIIPQLLISLMVFLSYLIAKQIVDDKKSALIVSVLVGFMPLAISETLNKLSVYFLAIPLIFFMIYCLIRINKRIYKISFLISALIISLLDPIFLSLIFVFIFYLLLLYVEDVDIHKSEIKTIIVSIFLIVIVNLFILKDAIFMYGLNVIYKNIPQSLLINAFRQVDVLTLVYNIGYIPLILGVVSVYYGITKQKSRVVLLLSSLALVILSFLSLKLMSFYVGLTFVGISASILSVLAINKLVLYLNLTKLSKYNYLIVPIFILLVFLLSVNPSYAISKRVISDAPTPNEIETLLWVKEKSSINDTILGSVFSGNLISAITHKKNLMDTNFLFAPDPMQRLIDAETIYTTDNYDRAAILFKKYNIKYIFLSNTIKDIYGIKDLGYSDSKCIEKHEFVYRVIC